MKYFLYLGISIFLLTTVYPQQDSLWQEDNFINQIEMSSSIDEENLLFEYLEDLKTNPVNVNNAEFSDLLRIPGISRREAKSILEYRKASGHIFTLFELYSITEINANKLRSFFPFMITDEKIIKNINNIPEPQSPSSELRSRLITDVQPKPGYTTNIFQGNSYKLYNSFNIKSENYNAGLLTEKDPGEKDYTDHTVFFIQLKQLGIIRSVIAGDYNIEFGRGNAIWSPYGFSKTPASFAGYREGRNSVPYLSTDEGNYLRGTAVNVKINNFNLTAFYSNKLKDAVLDSAQRTINSVSSDGYHRTVTELNKSEVYKEVISGSDLMYNTELFSAGFLYYNLSTEYPFASDKYPAGKSFDYFSISYSFPFRRLQVSGEISLFRKSFATIHSINFDISDKIRAVITLRNVSPGYFSFLSSAIKKESGIYAGISISSLPGNLNLYYDSYSKMTSANIFPVNGNKLLVQYDAHPFTDMLCRLKYTRSTMQRDDNIFTEVTDHNVSSELIYKLNRSMTWKFRIDYTSYSDFSNEKGYAFYQEIIYWPLKKELEIYGRITLFNTGSFLSRVYQYEKDLTGTFNMNPLFNEGVRWFIGANFTISPGSKLQCKYSETYKPDAEFLGSGYNKIKGGLDNQISVQLDIKI